MGVVTDHSRRNNYVKCFIYLMHLGGESLDRMLFSFSYTVQTVRSALLGTSEVTISFTTMKKFLLTISMKCQADENKEKYQSRDW